MPNATGKSDRNDQLKFELSDLLQNLLSLVTRFNQLPDSKTRILEAAIENMLSIQRALGKNKSSWSEIQRK